MKPKVLIVDDEPDILLMLRVSLEAEGYETLLAGDGETALRRIREERPDVVLLDVMMPVLDGWGVLEQLAACSPRPKVVVLTAKGSDRDRSRAWELGADEYLTKPFDPDDLLGTIDTVCRNRSTGRRDYIEAVYQEPSMSDAARSGSIGINSYWP